MFRSLLSACSITVLVLPTLLLSTKTSACPVKLPETLLSLYKNSDAIYVARYERAVDAAIIEDTADGTEVTVRKHFDVSTALKGEPRKLLVLDEREYRYKIDQSETPAETRVEEAEDEVDALYERPNLEPGDTVLLFLKNYPQENGEPSLGLTDYRDAIKKLSGERMDAYQSRIRELNSIFGEKKTADNATIVDWLVKTTQDPLTRWEGAFELQQSYEIMQWQENEKKRTDEEHDDEEDAKAVSPIADASPAGEAESAEATSNTEVVTDAESEDFDNSVYARLLTAAQKETLTNVLLASASERPADPNAKKRSMSEGGNVLIELVSNWGDSRLAKFLLQELQNAAQDPYLVYRLMTTTVRVMGDKELEQISEKYGDVYYQDGDSFVDTEDSETEAADNDSDEDEPAEVVEENSADTETAATDEDIAIEGSGDEAMKARRVTYSELRAELVSKFVVRAPIVIANAETKEMARADH